MKTNTLPEYSPDPITALLRTRPDAVRGIIKAFGWRFHGSHGWICPIWFEGQGRFAILNLWTLAWRVGPKGKQDTKRGWLARSFEWYFKMCATPRDCWSRETARIIQQVTGPWPELQAACDLQGRAWKEGTSLPPPRTMPAPPQPVPPASPLLLDCSHGWPDEPGSAPNVTPFLRKWNGPRGDGGAA